MTKSDFFILRALEISAAPNEKAKHIWMEEAELFIRRKIENTTNKHRISGNSKRAKAGTKK